VLKKIFEINKLTVCLIIGFLLLNSVCFAQKDTLTFKISKAKYEAEVITNDTVFRVYQKNYFHIKKSDDIQITRVEVLNGKVTIPTQNNYCVTFTKSGSSYVKVYAKNVKGESFVACIKAIKVVDFDLPNLFVSGVKADSAIDVQHLIKTGIITAYSEQLKQPIRVLSFGVVMGNDTIYVVGNGFPIEVKNRFQYMKSGDQLELYNVRVEFPNENRTVKIIPRFSVFITETDQYSTGTRKFIENKNSSPFGP
jgi:hypothetical protein